MLAPELPSGESSSRGDFQLAFDAVPSHRKYPLRLARYAGMAEAIASYLSERSPVTAGLRRILELGPGRGRSFRFCRAAGIADKLQFWGIDRNPMRLQTICEPSEWRLALGDVQDGLPYQSGYFDICVCEQVLEHLTEPEGVVKEMSRVLRPGGLMIVGVPVFPAGIAQVRAWSVAHLDPPLARKRSHIQTFTAGSISAMVCSCHPPQLVECRGFRLVSGGPLGWLEDYVWWYRVNRWLGRALPHLCTEVQLILRKAPDPGKDQATEPHTPHACT